MSKGFFEKKCRYSIRKLALGTCSVMIGASFLSTTVSADSVEEPTGADSSMKVEEDKAVTTEQGLPAAPVMPVSAATENPVEKVSESVNPPAVSDEHKQAASVEVADVPKNEEAVLRPKEIKFDTWDELLKWEPGARADDDINKASVPLATRHQGELVNEKASPDAKVQALSNTNSKAKDHASVGGEEFKSYAFDYWQYLDSMVFWEGLVPTPDVIDAGHRNGVPVYGTLFFNWSNSIADQERFAEALKQDEDGTFPIARKLVDLAKYYGFDGYFINQETTGEMVKPLGKKMRDFMLYSKEYAEKVAHPIQYSWYDAMTYEYGRYHEDGLGDYNYPFMQKEGERVPADKFFANFNWNKAKNDYSVETAKWLGRSQFDVLAGLELQRGGSYHTKVDWQALLDENGKLRLSLGLFAPDTITSLGKTGEEYHQHENIFFTGYQGDPTGQKPSDKDWYGIANLVADRTAAVGKTFSTSFNTGHGRKWFVDGEVSKDSEWNYRSVAGILPTWRWWQSSSAEKLKADYDFEDAYNGGNSLKFAGDVSKGTTQDVKLYSTKLEVTEHSQLTLAHKGGQHSKVYLALATNPQYQFNDAAAWLTLTPSADWKKEVFDLSSLAGKTIYGIKLYFEHDDAVKDYQFNLGQLSISDQQEAPQAPQEVHVARQVLKNAQEAEAIVAFKASPDADYYEVYQQDGGKWQLLTGSSNTTIYLPKVTRSADSQGKSQTLKVVAVGKNGQRSDAGLVDFDWGLTVSDTSLPRALAPNIVLGAKVIGSSFASKEGESIENMLNGTITSLSDKWSAEQLHGNVDIRLTQPRQVVRWVMDHAGAGGESVNDGLMNTKDFDLYYKDAAGEWKLAKAVRGNKAHVTDVTLDQPITAQDWRLQVLTADNGTPWRAIRIYNWKMYETLDTESENIPMAHVAARSLGNQTVQVGFKDVAKDAKIFIYDSQKATQPLATVTADQAGDLASDILHFDTLPQLLYYRTQLPGKEISNLLAVQIPQENKKIAKVSLESLPSKKIYREGENLSVKGGVIRVQFEGDYPDELVQLSHKAVTITGFDSHQLGEQDLQISYLDKVLDNKWPVYLVKASEAGEKVIAGLHLTKTPKTNYTVGEDLDLSEGRFEVLFDDESTEEHDLSEAVVTGFDKEKAGRQTVTVTFKDHQTSFDVLVSPKATANDEYLKQAISKAEAGLAEISYRFASPEKQEQLSQQLSRAKEVAANHDAHQDEVDQALQELTQLVAALDGQDKYQATVKLLQDLKIQGKEKLKTKTDKQLEDLLAQVDSLLESKTAGPADFAKLEESLREQLTPKVESHVGSLEKGEESGPVAEELPSLLVEDQEIAFTQQKRENPDLPKGQVRKIQTGVSGKERQFITVDSEGHRRLQHTEVLSEALPEIIEIGTKVAMNHQEAHQRGQSANHLGIQGEEMARPMPVQPRPEAMELSKQMAEKKASATLAEQAKVVDAKQKEAHQSLPETGDASADLLALEALAALGLASAGLVLKKRRS